MSGRQPVPIRHLLNLLHSDVEALVAHNVHLQPADRQFALDVLLAALCHLRTPPCSAEVNDGGRAILL